jgi:multiple sugar transport system substrate-binding protein
MKRLFIVQCALTVAILAACGGKAKQAAGGISTDFFDKAVSGEITISAYESMEYKSFLEEAARAFEAINPGTKVNVETFSAMPERRSSQQGNLTVMVTVMQDDPQGKADYISRVNTNLMSGKGADLYAMDVLPLHKFAANGTLENLDSYMAMDPNFNKSDYRKNILDAVRYQNGTWFLPLKYDFNYYAYDATLVPMEIASGFGTDKAFSSEDLLKIGMGLYNGNYKIFNINGSNRLFTVLLRESIQSYLDLSNKKPNFVDGSFTAMLDSVKNYGRQGLIPQEVTDQQDVEQFLRQRMEAPTDRFYFKQYNSIILLSQFLRSTGVMNRMMTGGSAMAIDTDDKIAGIQANADGSVPFTYRRAFGINSQSKNKETAWAFLKFLLSGEVQDPSDLMTGFYLDNKAREETTGLAFSASMGRPSNSGGGLNEQQVQALTQYRATVEKMSDSINCFVAQDTSLNDMIYSEVQYYFDGSKTADEVARVLQNKANLYLNE